MNQDLLINWLGDAYGMAQAQAMLLKRFASDYERHPDVKTRLDEHLEEVRQQIADLQEHIRQLGGTPHETSQADLPKMPSVPFDDTLIQNLVQLHTVEQFLHAAYAAIARAALLLGQEETEHLCSKIAAQDQSAADWACSQLDVAVEEYLTTRN